eukprot:2026226-Alexandrium_andersonii.AAC.1
MPRCPGAHTPFAVLVTRRVNTRGYGAGRWRGVACSACSDARALAQRARQQLNDCHCLLPRAVLPKELGFC